MRMKERWDEHRPGEPGVYRSDGSHTDEQALAFEPATPVGKYICGVFFCSVPRGANRGKDIDLLFTRQIFPCAHGYTKASTDVTHGPTSSTFLYLMNNKRQCTPDDLVDRIADLLGWSHKDPRITVYPILAVPN